MSPLYFLSEVPHPENLVEAPPAWNPIAVTLLVPGIFRAAFVGFIQTNLPSHLGKHLTLYYVHAQRFITQTDTLWSLDGIQT